jgi:transposase
MTVQEQLDKLTQIAATALESIQALGRVTAAHTEQIGELIAHQARTDASIRALADEIIATQREWQACLRRISPQ